MLLNTGDRAVPSTHGLLTTMVRRAEYRGNSNHEEKKHKRDAMVDELFPFRVTCLANSVW